MSGRHTPSGLASLTELHAGAAAAERHSALLGGPFAVIMVALAGLPLVNARDGYAAGDALIAQSATGVLAVALASAGFAGRHGSARFALVLSDAGPDGAQAVAAALRDVLPPAAGAQLAIAVRRPAESGDQVLQRARDQLRGTASRLPAIAPLRAVAEGESRHR
jgi:GGDEF domain-containing protein